MIHSIEHTGRIKSHLGNKYTIEIIQNASCSTCSAKGSCNALSTENKTLEIDIISHHPHRIGDTVTVYTSLNTGLMAVLYAYIFPFLVLLITLAIGMAAGLNELFATLLALGLMVVYFVVLRMFQSGINNTVHFEIK